MADSLLVGYIRMVLDNSDVDRLYVIASCSTADGESHLISAVTSLMQFDVSKAFFDDCSHQFYDYFYVVLGLLLFASLS